MGAIFSRWKKQPSTLERLEKLDTEICLLEELKQSNLTKQKKLIGSLLLYSVLLYVIAAVVFYFLYLPKQWSERVKYSTPLLVFPFLVWFLKRFLHWYFVKRITGNDGQLERLKEERSKIIEDVMEKETYKKAREILQRFDPERFQALETPPATPVPARAPLGQELRQRKGSDPVATATVRPTPRAVVTERESPPSASCPSTPAATHRTTQQHKAIAAAAAQAAAQNPQQQPRGTAPGPPMVRPVLPRERGIVDRLVEYLVGDGPQNRYALICRNCSSHNGMALREEFEYIAFRCCYCHTPNPPRKRRPSAPKLAFDTPPPKHRPLGKPIEEKEEEESEAKDEKKPASSTSSNSLKSDISESKE